MFPATRSFTKSWGFALLMLFMALPQSAASQGGPTIAADAFGVHASTPLGSLGPTPLVALPPDGTAQQDGVANLALPGVLSTGAVSVAVSGTLTAASASALATASVANVSLLGGAITAQLLEASSASSVDGNGASSSAAGTSFSNLVVAGTAVPANPPPNTALGVPGVATVVVNEQVAGGDGVTSSSLEVNMLHVTLLLGGEIIIGHAKSAAGALGACTGSGETCESVDDCSEGEGCCGDGEVDAPETCDLGLDNGQPGSTCSRSCGIGDGVCTGSGAVCESAADCPAGEGCCGDGVSEGDEQCDDGNSVPDDTCTNSCANNQGGHPVVGCEDIPSASIVPMSLRRSSFLDQNGDTHYERWKMKGDFSLFSGTAIDPDSEPVRLIFNQGSTAIYDVTLPPGSFVQKGSITRPKWQFANKSANTPGAQGWRKAKFSQKLNKVKVLGDGKFADIPMDTGPQPLSVRQTIRIDDVCATAVVTCLPTNRGVSRLVCRSGIQ